MTVLSFKRNSYTAKSFRSPYAGQQFQMSGTLDGYIDLATPNDGTYQLSLDEARALIAGLHGVIEDIKANCLYDRDAFLLPEGHERT